MRSPDSYTTATINAWCKQLQRPHASGVQQRQGSSLVSGCNWPPGRVAPVPPRGCPRLVLAVGHGGGRGDMREGV